MADAQLDGNSRPALTAVSNADGTTPVRIYADPNTHRLLVDLASGSGTVTSVSVVTANGFAGSVATATTTPAITLSTTVNAPILAGNGTAIAAATTTGSGSTAVLATAPTFPTNITIGAAAGTTGSILFKGTTSGTVTLSVADAAGTYTLKLPTTDGDSGQFLQTDGSGNTTWAAPSASGITIGTTTITSGTDTRILYDNAGVVGEYTLTGTGTVVVMQTAPTFVTSITTPSVLASANDSGALGASGTAFSDLFLASGGIIDFAAGDVTITHSSNLLTLAGGSLTVTPPAATDTSFAAGLGSATTPAFAFSADPNTGFFSPTADRVGLTLAGTPVARWSAVTQNMSSALGLTWVNTTNADTGTGDTTLSRISAGVVGVGTGSVGEIDGTLSVSTIELGNGSDTTLSRSSAGQMAIEGVQVVTLSNAVTLTNKTLTSPTITTATLSGAQQLAEGAGIRLDPTLSADGTYSGTTITGTAGATLAFGDLIYLASADSRWELTDADSVTTAGPVWIGMCVQAAAADGDPTTILLQGNIRADAAFPALTVGAPAYVGTTAGDIQVAAPSGDNDVVRIVGHALTADSLYFNPSTDWVVLVV